MDFNLDVLLSAAGGTLTSTTVAFYFLKKALLDLDAARKQIAEITKELAAMAVKLQGHDKNEGMLHDHDRKIAAIEGLIYGSRTRTSSVH